MSTTLRRLGFLTAFVAVISAPLASAGGTAFAAVVDKEPICVDGEGTVCVYPCDAAPMLAVQCEVVHG